jgi:hypothetical protein
MDDWIAFWNSKHAIYVNARHPAAQLTLCEAASSLRAGLSRRASH